MPLPTGLYGIQLTYFEEPAILLAAATRKPCARRGPPIAAPLHPPCFTQIKCCVMEHWGFAKAFATAADARAHLHGFYPTSPSKTNSSTVVGEVVPYRLAETYARRMVEVMNGRQVYHKATGIWSIDATKLTYDQLLPLLTKLRDAAIQHSARRQRRQRMKAGLLTFDFPQEKAS